MKILIALVLVTGCLNAQNLLNGPEGIFYHSPTSIYFVANALDGKIITVDSQSVHTEFKDGLSMPMAVLVVDEVLYVSANEPKKLYGFNINDGSEVLNIDIADAVGLSGMCYDPRTDLIYIADQGGRILSYQIGTNEITPYLDAGISQSVQDIALDIPNNRLVICFYAYSLALKEIDLDTDQVSTISGTGGGNHVGINMDQTGHFYISNWSTNEVLYYNNDFSESGIFSTDHDQPVGITFNYDINFLAVANFGGNSIDLNYLYLTEAEDEDIPDSGALDLQIYPNPFNPLTTISLSTNTEDAKSAELGIYNIKGQKIRSFILTFNPALFDGSGYDNAPRPSTELLPSHSYGKAGTMTQAGRGKYSVTWDGTDEQNQLVPSGVYFCKIEAGGKHKAEKMILLK